MSTNFVRPGNTFEHPATATFTKNVGYVVSGVFGVSSNSGVSGDTQILERTGAWNLPADAGFVPAKGDLVYWDDTSKTCKATGSGRFLIGVAAAPKVGSTLEVILDGISVVAVP